MKHFVKENPYKKPNIAYIVIVMQSLQIAVHYDATRNVNTQCL